MTFSLIFWIVMLIWLLGLFFNFFGLGPVASSGVLFVLFLLLGWKVFGPPVRM